MSLSCTVTRQPRSGNVQYGAPEGYHDDCVVALALAAWQLKQTPPPGKGVGFIKH